MLNLHFCTVDFDSFLTGFLFLVFASGLLFFQEISCEIGGHWTNKKT